MDTASTLGSVELFSGLSPRQLAEIAGAAYRRRFSARKHIVSEGEEGYAMYVILQGRVAVGRMNSEGENVLFHELGPGEFFGEISLLSGLPRTADVVAITQTQLLVIEKSAFVRCVRSSPDLAMHLIGHLSRRLVQTDTARISKQSVRQRLIHVLCTSAIKQGERHVLTISKVALGERILARRETVSRELSRLECEGIVRLDRKDIEISSMERLRGLARNP